MSHYEHQNVSELTQGLLFESFYLLSDAQIRQSKNGSPYLFASLSDNSGKVNAIAWDYNGSLSSADTGKIVFVDGQAGVYNGARQVICTTIELATEEECEQIDLEEIIPFAPVDCEHTAQKMRELLVSIEDEDYRNITLFLFDRLAYMLTTFPAAKSIHHAYIGGWLIHTYGMMLVAAKVYEAYSLLYTIDRSLLLAGCFVHDIGKLQEFDLSDHNLVQGYTTDGRLIGHSVLGALLLEAADSIGDYPVEKVRQLQHITLSHQGSPECGAAVLPQTLEAETVNYLDGLDSRMDIYTNALSKTDEGQFSEYIAAIGKSIYHISSKVGE